MFGEEPATELGRAEAKWRERSGVKAAAPAAG